MIRSALSAAVFVVGVVLAPARAESPVQATRPNILLIQADDLGYGDLERVRASQVRDAVAGSARPRRHPVHQLLRRQHGLRSVAGVAPDRPAHRARRGSRQQLAPDARRAPDRGQPAALRRLSHRGDWQMGTRRPDTTGQPDRQGFEYSFGFLDHRHAHRQFTDHLYRNAQRVAVDLERDYVNDLFTREAESFIERHRRAPVLPLPELHRAARRSARAGRLAGAAARKVPGNAVREPHGRCRGNRRDHRRTLARLPLAAGAARRIRRDDPAHGPRHRPARGPDRLAQDRAATR